MSKNHFLNNQAREPRRGILVGASPEKFERACELSGLGQARCPMAFSIKFLYRI